MQIVDTELESSVQDTAISIQTIVGGRGGQGIFRCFVFSRLISKNKLVPGIFHDIFWKEVGIVCWRECNSIYVHTMRQLRTGGLEKCIR